MLSILLNHLDAQIIAIKNTFAAGWGSISKGSSVSDCIFFRGSASGSGRAAAVIACDKREAFAQGSVGDEAIRPSASRAMDCFASLAMTLRSIPIVVAQDGWSEAIPIISLRSCGLLAHLILLIRRKS